MEYGYKIFLSILRSLVYIKRAAIWAWRQIARGAAALEQVYQNTIGFRIYKMFLFLRKQKDRWFPSFSWGGGVTDFFGKRGTLQAALFLVAFFLMLPHTRLVAKDATSFPGRKTILYSLVGPPEEGYDFEEVLATTPTAAAVPVWKEGTVAPSEGAAANAPSSDISTIIAGGSAVTKPTILPGNFLSAPAGASVQRSQIVLHEVKDGEVIGSIAAQYGINIATVLSANGLRLNSRIHPGDTLKILPVNGVLYTVKRGDTVQKIARAYKAEAGDIISFNKLRSDGSDIAVGEQLVLPGSIAPALSPVPVRKYTALSSIAAPPSSVEAPAGSGYIWPTAVRRITQYFTLVHNGIDIAGPIGTPLYAARAGTVVKSQCGYNGGYGCHIIIDHGDNYRTLYGHASQLFVNVGDYVEQGQTVAAMGSTGHSTGPHVHFEVRYNNRNQNPLRFVR